MQLKQLPKSQNVFCKTSSALGLTSSISKGIWPTIYSVWEFWQHEFLLLDAVGIDVPALKPSLIFIQ